MSAVIDSLEFAQSGRQLNGKVPAAQLGRLSDSLFDAEGGLNFELSGYCDTRQRPRLQLTVSGMINLKCQRCLGSLPYSLAVESSLLVLIDSAGGDTAEFEDLDGVPADAHTDVRALIEDEVLLAMPMAARHADGQCDAVVDTSQDSVASPFAVLARLKQQRI